MDHMRRPSPARAELLREFMVSRFSSNKDAKAQGATTKRQRYFSKESLDIIQMVRREGGKKGKRERKKRVLKGLIHM